MNSRLKLFGLLAAGTMIAAIASTGPALAGGPTTVVTHYEWKNAAEYNAKWTAPYGPGEGAVAFKTNAITVNATPFTTGQDFSVFDHLKYIRISRASFAVPQAGSLEFGVDIDALTPATQPGRVIHGCYGSPG